MRYMLLIYDDEKNRIGLPEAELNKLRSDYGKLIEELKTNGTYVAGAALQGISTATTVRVREGKRLVTDGPFAETREQLGGYFVIEAKNLDEAASIAARVPSSRTGTVEVRPVLEVALPAGARL